MLRVRTAAPSRRPDKRKPRSTSLSASISQYLIPVDKLTVIYLAIVGIIVAFFHRGIDFWPLLVGGHLLAVTLLVSFVYLAETTRARFLLFLRDIYPLLIYTFLFLEISRIMNILFDFWLEAALIRWDLALFGTHPTVWLQQFHTPLLTELMAFSYWSYYLLFPLSAVVLYLQKDKSLYRSFVFSLSFTLYFCYLSYLFLSARGPHETLAELHTYREVAGWFDMMVRDLQNNVSISGAAFPSSHVAAVWIMLIYLFKFKKWLGWALLPLILALTFSTVYMRYHYAVDAIAGVLLVGVTYPAARQLYRILSSRPHGARDSGADT